MLDNPDYMHGTPEKIGVLLVNLGTPTAPDKRAVRAYLREFLSDPRVVETPRWLWNIILYCIVLPFRSPRTAAAYQSIWTAAGSPLMTYSRAQQQKLTTAFAGLPIEIALGMRYGKPAIANALRELHGKNCRRLFILPLYPQYASSTSGTVFAAAMQELSTWRAVPHVRFAAAYGDDHRYIDALAKSITTHQQQHGTPQQLIFSFHGMPQAMLNAGDHYHCHCHKTARQTAAALHLSDDAWQVTFQSRFGRAEWLRPYTDQTMQGLPQQGLSNVQVVCPAFSCDCLETLEEIAVENRQLFLAAGGAEFSYIPALNDSPSHMEFLQALIMDNIGDWLDFLQAENATAVRDLQKTAAAAMQQKSMKK